MVKSEIRSVFSSGGSTLVAYNKSGSKLLVAGTTGVVRVYDSLNDLDEPESFDILEEASDLIVLDDDRFAVSSITGEVDLYSISKRDKIRTVLRSPLPVRSIVFTHNGTMIAGAGDDDEVQIAPIESSDSRATIKFRPGDQVHDISYNPTTDLLTLSLSDGNIKFYSLTLEEPKLVTTISGEIPRLIYQDDDDLAEDNVLTAKIDWSSNGDDFAIPTDNRIIKIFSRSNDFQLNYSFSKIHDSKLTAVKWSPNGEYIASSDLSNNLLIWDSKTRDCLINEKFSSKVNNLYWNKNELNGYDLSCGSENGNIIILNNLIKQSSSKPTFTSNLIDDLANEALDSDSDENEEGEADDINLDSEISKDDVNGLKDFDDDDGFLDDDDNAGYAIPKRPIDIDDDLHIDEPRFKKPLTLPAFDRSYKLKPYNPGCTPYISDRRYLTMNSVGYISSVKQDTFSSITVSFFDQSVHREYYFDDIYGYDLAGLTKVGVILGSSGENKNKSTAGKVLFRPHDDMSNSWEKKIPLKDGEIITSLSLSDSIVIVGTSFGYMRSYNLFGTPIGIEKISPIFGIISNFNYIFIITLANQNQLLYSFKDIENGTYLQKDLSLPLELPNKGEDLLNGIFFNSHGDPILIGNDGVVLLLTRWRNPLQATWVPILDSELKIREMGGKGELNIWPLGLHKDKLNCILVRGSNNYPNYPLPLPTELDIKFPLTNDEEPTDADIEEESSLRFKTMGEILGETLANDGEIFEDDQDTLVEYAINFDRSLLKLFSQACTEEKLAKAWKIVQDLKQDKALSAASKMAERVGLNTLVNRINKLIEQRMESELE